MNPKIRTKQLLLLGLLLFGIVSAQAQKVTLNFKETKFETVLNAIKTQTGLGLVFSEQLVDLSKKVSIDVKDEPVERALDRLLAGTPLTYEIKNKKLYLIDKRSSAEGSSSKGVVKKISGVVTDENGESVIGANVFVKGTTNGVITDIDGNFSLNAPGDAVIVVSYVGYAPMEVAVNNRSTLDVKLQESAIKLDEVVAIGYGTAKRREVVGAITKVEGASIEKLKTTSIAQGLQGMSSGLNVTNDNGGVAGAGANVQIRGISSINLSSEPLWVVDGVPILTKSAALEENGVVQASPLSMINPNDIESVEVLKDAAATAIYGNRASGGVILVTTKSSKKNMTGLEVSYDGGASMLPVTQNYFVNNKEYVALRDEANANIGLDPFDPVTLNGLFYTNPNITREQAETVNINQLDYLARTAFFHQIGLKANKGFDTSGMLFSLNYRDEEGILRENALKRLNIRFSTHFRPLQFVEMGASANLMYLGSKGVQNNGGTKQGGGFIKWYSALPFYKIYDEENITGYWLPESGYNSAAMQDPGLVQNNSNEYRALANAYVQIDLPVKGLNVRGEVGVDADFTTSDNWYSKYMSSAQQSSAKARSATRVVGTWNGTINYSNTFHEIHKITATLGGEATQNYTYFMNGAGRDLGTIYPELINPNPALGISVSAHRGNDMSLAGFFVRGNYSFKSRYIISGSIRRDGHAALSTANRWATFAAGGVAWIITEESFMKPTAGWLSTLKLRSSYGSTGNTNMSAEMLSLLWGTSGDRGWYSGIPGIQFGPSGSSDLKWETTTTFDVGLDFGFLNDRINGSVSYYNKDVKDLIMKAKVPWSAGYTGEQAIWKNIGRIYSRGVELNISSVNIHHIQSSFRWTTDFNISTNKNRVTELDAQEANGVSEGRTMRKVGEALGTYYIADYAGVNADKGYYQIYELDKEPANEGIYRRTGKILPMSNTNVSNNRFLMSGKTAAPLWYGGITNTFFYKNIDFGFQFTFAGGHWLWDSQLFGRTTTGGGNIDRDLLGNYWQKPGDVAKYAQLTANQSIPVADDGGPGTSGYNNIDNTSWMLSRGDYLRLRNIQLGYTLPSRLTSKIKLNNIRFYGGASNLLLLHGYSGVDPESGTHVVPAPITINFGVSFKL